MHGGFLISRVELASERRTIPPYVKEPLVRREVSKAGFIIWIVLFSALCTNSARSTCFSITLAWPSLRKYTPQGGRMTLPQLLHH